VSYTLPPTCCTLTSYTVCIVGDAACLLRLCMLFAACLARSELDAVRIVGLAAWSMQSSLAAVRTPKALLPFLGCAFCSFAAPSLPSALALSCSMTSRSLAPTTLPCAPLAAFERGMRVCSLALLTSVHLGPRTTCFEMRKDRSALAVEGENVTGPCKCTLLRVGCVEQTLRPVLRRSRH
jgi:hypothetical protein